MPDTMRILMLVPQLPYPPHQGTSLRNFGLIAGLAYRHQIHLLCFLPPQRDLDQIEPLRILCQDIQVIPEPVRTLRQRLVTTFTSLLPDMAHRLASPALQARLADILEKQPFDVIELEGIEMVPYLSTVLGYAKRSAQRPQIVFDDHNAEYVLQKRVFETDIGRPRRWPGALYSFIQWQKLKRYEAWACRQADAVVAVSEKDADALRQIVPGLDVSVIPNGIDISYYSSFVLDQPILPPHSLVFTGTMDYRPNVDAALWFAQEVLPLIRQQAPDVQFYIVGQRPHRRLSALVGTPGVIITGAVPDTRPYIASAALYVIPLRSGGGTRFKVLEAMALRKAVVSTPMGCDGFPLTPGKEAVLADEPAQFARQTIALLNDPARGQELVNAGFEFAQQYDWKEIVPRLEAIHVRKIV